MGPRERSQSSSFLVLVLGLRDWRSRSCVRLKAEGSLSDGDQNLLAKAQDLGFRLSVAQNVG